MTDSNALTTSQEIRKFLTVIGGAVLCAALLVWGLVHYYGPSGNYQLNRVLLSPDVLENLSYRDSSPGAGAMGQFVFDKVEALHYDADTRQYVRTEVPLAKYRTLYAAITDDVSVPDLDGMIAGLFTQGQLTRVFLKVKPAGASHGNDGLGRVFQELQFSSDGDHYRVEIREDNPQQQWAYFQRSYILNTARQHLL